MGLLKILGFETKSATPVERETVTGSDTFITYMREMALPFVANANFVRLFETVPEVFWPIDFLSCRAAGAKYLLKKSSDDSVVWDNKEVNAILTKPNAVFSWYQTVYLHFAYKLCTGNAFIRAAADRDVVRSSLWKWCKDYWALPADRIHIEYQSHGTVPIFGVCDVEDIIKCYWLEGGFGRALDIDPREVMHDREANLDFTTQDYLMGKSRLWSVLKAISNIIAVYEARNVIYVKRGGLGWLVSAAKDDMGSRPLTSDEKKDILDQIQLNYGLSNSKYPYGVSDAPLSFIRTNLSISELEPFEETLADAIAIAGAFGIPSVLVPRKDQATYSNQATAEKGVYTSVIIPMVQRFCTDFTHFLGLDDDGYYIDADFSDVDCLQSGKKEEQEVHKAISDRCKVEFESGIITLNDWRAQQGYERVELPEYDKLVSEMTPDEIAKIKNFTNPKNNEDEREVSDAALQDEGE